MDRGATQPCRLRIETDHPCPRPVTTEILSVSFGESCAREQGAYVVIGELTQELTVVRTKRPRGALVADASPGRYTGYGRISASAPL